MELENIIALFEVKYVRLLCMKNVWLTLDASLCVAIEKLIRLDENLFPVEQIKRFFSSHLLRDKIHQYDRNSPTFRGSLKNQLLDTLSHVGFVLVLASLTILF